MKRIFFITVLALLGCASLQAYERVWSRYDLIDAGNDVTRSIAYNPVSDEVYVASRLGGDAFVLVLDPETGVTRDTLARPEGGYAGGIYPLNMVCVDDDGAIYLGNLSVPAIIATDKFKIYRYENSASEPSVVFRGSLNGARCGDSFAAIGSGENVHLYASGMGNDKIVEFTASADTFAVKGLIPLPGSGAARHGISPVSPGGDIWINGTDASTWPAHLIDPEGNVIAVVPDSLIASGASTLHHWNVGNMNILTVVNPFTSNSLRSARYEVFSDALGDSYTFGYLGGNSDSLLFAYNGTTLNNNINGSAVIDYDTTRHRMYVVMGVNSVTAVGLDPLIQVSTPRDHGFFSIQIDGKNEEYTHYDFMEQSGENRLYATWSEQLMYLALSGNSLYAPYQSHQLYLAFDTDPGSGNGSPAPPTGDGGVTALPFPADVVVRLDSDTYPLINLEGDPSAKWTGGQVYKFNGSSWTSSEISGFDINYGAMAVVGDRNDSLITEIAVAKTTAGIGTNLEAVRFILYLVEQGASGDILAVFPVSNSGTAFDRYYSLDSLGIGQLPRRVVRVNDGRGVGTAVLIPENTFLEANYPNPFNPLTRLRYHLSEPGNAEIAIYDVAGRKIRSLVRSYHDAGSYEVTLQGAGLASGVYFYRLLREGAVVQTRKMVLLK
ncbi:MAG: T9SS type A sorting domain-containing protein [Candidatus Marinimicrobia bacterium]|nr:T9SS type A sorting domain-containing protein [Candidatus Neomarinimicrobiota bacterium]